MNIWDILILLAVAALVALAIRAIRGGKAGVCHDCSSAGCCAGGCEHCGKSCSKTKQ